MVLTVLLILALAAFIATIFSAVNPAKCPLWIPVVLICVYLLILQLPVGKGA